ncbi:uncharacterized protein [Nicotiana tomentosiformis]|uniref:uncharacterized protein n=1 Tax=Nicotiana tomentosiformis TaxID=4098 RepID=UPI00388C858C
MVAAPIAAPPAQPDMGRGGVDRGCPREGSQARFYAFLRMTEAFASDAVVTSMVSIFHRDASVLFDLGSTYSYVSSYFAPYLDIIRDSLSSLIYVSKPVGDSIFVERVYGSCLVVISGFETRVDLLLLSMAKRMVEKGYDAYLAFVRDDSVDTPTIESVPVVRDFPDVFPAYLLGMLPNRDIDFGIDLLSGTQPISIGPYRMAPAELKE